MDQNRITRNRNVWLRIWGMVSVLVIIISAYRTDHKPLMWLCIIILIGWAIGTYIYVRDQNKIV